MKVAFISIILLFISCAALTQSITGRWRSADGTRIYYIYAKGDGVEAILEQSSRVTDKPGVMILTEVEKKKGGKYKGLIHTTDHSLATVAIMKLETGNILRLRLRRFGLPAVVKWYREI